MLTADTFSQIIKDARLALTDPGPTSAPEPRRTKASGTDWFTLTDEETPVRIKYGLNDLYILCFEGKNGSFRFSDTPVTPGEDATDLGFAGDYLSLGYNRTSPITVTIDQVYFGLQTIWNAKASKKPDRKALLPIVIAFAEAIRFDDVLKNIIDGTPISDLDWSKHKDLTQVKVVKS